MIINVLIFLCNLSHLVLINVLSIVKILIIMGMFLVMMNDEEEKNEDRVRVEKKINNFDFSPSIIHVSINKKIGNSREIPHYK